MPARFYLNILLGAFATLAPRRARPRLSRLLANHALVESPEQLAPVMLAARTWRTWRTRRPAARRFDDHELRSVRVPIQLLLGARSSLLRPERAVARARDLITGIRAEIVPGAGHGLPMEEPDLVNRRILDFVGGVDGLRTAGHGC
ncbi:alpha/beta fold hydrolase [Plantactinospora sonchi]|uniref:Alpha/beta hydrolase n=1 Tax=Plantactinospora sonchi TaxID=1544735 RepID=A0ABU7RVJ6_9ACTN